MLGEWTLEGQPTAPAEPLLGLFPAALEEEHDTTYHLLQVKDYQSWVKFRSSLLSPKMQYLWIFQKSEFSKSPLKCNGGRAINLAGGQTLPQRVRGMPVCLVPQARCAGSWPGQTQRPVVYHIQQQCEFMNVCRSRKEEACIIWQLLRVSGPHGDAPLNQHRCEPAALAKSWKAASKGHTSLVQLLLLYCCYLKHLPDSHTEPVSCHLFYRHEDCGLERSHLASGQHRCFPNMGLFP
jgi:hypothetical protein